MKMTGIAMIQENKPDTQASLVGRIDSHLLFHSIPTPMYIYAQETLRIAQVNEAFTHTYGYSQDEACLTTNSRICFNPLPR
jgi:PAS domain-containing protein